MTSMVADECYTFERVPDPAAVRDPLVEACARRPAAIRRPRLPACPLTARPPSAGQAAVTRRSVPLRTHDKEPRTSSERAAARGVVRVQRDLSGINFFPFLLCNVGTGCSILKAPPRASRRPHPPSRPPPLPARPALAQVTSESQFERVSGTALGGGTFLGLCRRLTKAASFKEAPVRG